MGIKELMNSRQAPLQHPFVERVIGSIRRDCTDHINSLSERHLLRVLKEYAAYYNESRTNLAVDGNSPEEREVETKGPLVREPVLGGLHHRYRRVS